MGEIQYLDKLIDELTRGKRMEKILRGRFRIKCTVTEIIVTEITTEITPKSISE